MGVLKYKDESGQWVKQTILVDVDSEMSDTSSKPVKNSTIKAYVDTQDASTLSSAKSYADTQDATNLAAAKSYSDTNLATAKTYAEEKASAAETSAKSYADEKLAMKADLGDDGKVKSEQLPSFVDDIIEGYYKDGKFYKEDTYTTEITGETGKIYVDLSTNNSYRWSGSQFVSISMANVYTKEEVNTKLAEKQDTLVSGTNIKTINSESLLGSGDIEITGAEPDNKTIVYDENNLLKTAIGGYVEEGTETRPIFLTITSGLAPSENTYTGTIAGGIKEDVSELTVFYVGFYDSSSPTEISKITVGGVEYDYSDVEAVFQETTYGSRIFTWNDTLVSDATWTADFTDATGGTYGIFTVVYPDTPSVSTDQGIFAHCKFGEPEVIHYIDGRCISVDGTSIIVNGSGELEAIVEGKTYGAGNGIEITSDDKIKVLYDDDTIKLDDTLGLYAVSEVFKVTFTDGEVEGQLISDKTLKEIYDAYTAEKYVYTDAPSGDFQNISLYYANNNGDQYDIGFQVIASGTYVTYENILHSSGESTKTIFEFDNHQISHVSVPESSTSTTEISYIRIGNDEYKLAGSGSGAVTSVNGKTGAVTLKVSDLENDSGYVTAAHHDSSKVDTSLLGAVSGVATLGTDGKVPTAQLPDYMDDVIEGYYDNGKFYKDASHTEEITGSTGKLYIDTTTGKVYRYTGTAYAEISSSGATYTASKGIVISDNDIQHEKQYYSDNDNYCFGIIHYDKYGHVSATEGIEVTNGLTDASHKLSLKNAAATSTNPVSVSSGTISVGYDNSTIKVNESGQLYAEASGTTYTAGDGISITDSTIAAKVDNDTIKVKSTGELYTETSSQPATQTYTKSLTYGNDMPMDISIIRYGKVVDLTIQAQAPLYMKVIEVDGVPTWTNNQYKGEYITEGRDGATVNWTIYTATEETKDWGLYPFADGTEGHIRGLYKCPSEFTYSSGVITKETAVLYNEVDLVYWTRTWTYESGVKPETYSDGSTKTFTYNKSPGSYVGTGYYAYNNKEIVTDLPEWAYPATSNPTTQGKHLIFNQGDADREILIGLTTDNVCVTASHKFALTLGYDTYDETADDDGAPVHTPLDNPRVRLTGSYFRGVFMESEKTAGINATRLDMYRDMTIHITYMGQ